MTELISRNEVYAVIGAAIEVHTILGSGFLEAVYQEALEIELVERNIPFAARRELHLFYKGYRLEKTYVPDVLAFDQIVIEIKALDRLTSREEAQLLNYLKGTKLQIGLLINFGSMRRLEWKRMVRTQT